MGVTIYYICNNYNNKMGRKGDIESKSVSSRVPMEVFLKLQTQAFAQKKTMSGYLCDLLSKDNFSQGGQTKIEYRDKIVEKRVEVPIYRDRILEKKIEVPKIEYRDKIVEKVVEKIIEIPKIEYHTSVTVLGQIRKLEESNSKLSEQVAELQSQNSRLRIDNNEMYLEINPVKPFARKRR